MTIPSLLLANGSGPCSQAIALEQKIQRGGNPILPAFPRLLRLQSEIPRFD